jgi:hypothetical protein
MLMHSADAAHPGIPDACANAVQSEGSAIAAARSILEGMGSHVSRLTALRVDDPGTTRQYLLVIAGGFNEPISEAVVFRDPDLGEWAHAAFGAPQTYLDPAAAIAASGLPLSAVDNCRLIRVRVSPWGSDLTPVWEVGAGPDLRYVNQQGTPIGSDMESLMHRERGGGRD